MNRNDSHSRIILYYGKELKSGNKLNIPNDLHSRIILYSGKELEAKNKLNITNDSIS